MADEQRSNPEGVPEEAREELGSDAKQEEAEEEAEEMTFSISTISDGRAETPGVQAYVPSFATVFMNSPP